jgi:hypothetical protein
LDLYTPEQVLAEAPLLEGIQRYPANPSAVQAEGEGQVLYLRVLAKTAYFSSSKARMENPDPVDVDISKLPGCASVGLSNFVKFLTHICLISYPSLC